MTKTDYLLPAKKLTKIILIISGLLVMLVFVLLVFVSSQLLGHKDSVALESSPQEKPFVKIDTNFVSLWTAPAEWRLTKLDAEEQKLINYGKELIAHTSEYLGPYGTVARNSNGMNCQNCHLNAGSQPWGNNYFAVEANYPKFRERSGTVEDQTKRVNDCFERSLNGKALNPASREMQAILAYIRWLGSDVPSKTTPKGSGIYKLKGLKRPTSPEKGRAVYEAKCQSCHQANGEGLMAENGKSYTYPPLWGRYSYNIGAGLYRISNFAGYVKYNMPLGVSYEKPQLTDEEAWDVASFVNSQPRPSKDLSKDWPNPAGKPFDHPFGPYTDPFSENQHKYGPYKPIKEWKEAHKKSK